MPRRTAVPAATTAPVANPVINRTPQMTIPRVGNHVIAGEEITVTVPLMIAGQEMPEVNCRPYTQTVDLFSRFMNRIDPHPPYQRQDDVWSDDKGSKFIYSVMNHMPIPPFYFCPIAPGSDFFYPVDGLQRYKALHKFFNNQISIKVNVTKNGKTVKRKVTWNDLNSPANPEYAAILHKFQIYQFHVVEIDYLPLEKQRLVFVAINSGVPLNKDEDVYCSNFLARKFFDTVYKNVFSNLEWGAIFQKKVAKNSRFSQTHVCNELLNLCGIYRKNGEEKIEIAAGLRERKEGDTVFEGEESGDWFCPGLRVKDRQRSATEIHKRLTEENVEYHNDESCFLDKFDFDLELLKDVAEIHLQVLKGTQEKDKPQLFNARNVIDTLAFFFKKIQLKHLSIEQMKNHHRKCSNLISKYMIEKEKKNYKMQTSDPLMMTKKMDLLERLYKGDDNGRSWK